MDRLAELEERYDAVAERLRELERRLAALEAAPATPARGRPRARAAAAPAAAQARSDLAAALGSVSFVGRTLLVLAGAFVLRALTDAGTLPGWLGVALGLAYAGAWLALADRAGRAGAIASAGFHGSAAVLVGFPLLVEAASRFRLLSPAPAAALLALLTAGALLVAARRRLEALAWIVTLGGIATAAALAAAGGRLGPPAAYLVLLGAATLWTSWLLDWFPLRWPPALAADVAVAALAIRAGGADGASAALALLVLLVALYLGSIAARTLFLQRGVVAFEVVQTGAALAVGLGGAALVAARSGTSATASGAASVALGLAAYAVAFAFVRRRQAPRANFHFYASVAAVLLLAGSALLLPLARVAFAWAALGLAAAALARRRGEATLAAHAALYAVAAGIGSGLLAHAAEAVLASPGVPWTAATPAALTTLAASLGVAWLGAGAAARARPLERAPRLALLAVGACGAAGVAIGAAVPALAGTPGHGAVAGEVATVRTALLVAGALVLAWLGRSERWPEGRALAYPALAAIGLKILLEDVPRSRPATLFVAFACYGAALLLVPRLRGRRAAAVGT